MKKTDEEIMNRIEQLMKKQQRTDDDEEWEEWEIEIGILCWVLNTSKYKITI